MKIIIGMIFLTPFCRFKLSNFEGGNRQSWGFLGTINNVRTLQNYTTSQLFRQQDAIILTPQSATIMGNRIILVNNLISINSVYMSHKTRNSYGIKLIPETPSYTTDNNIRPSPASRDECPAR